MAVNSTVIHINVLAIGGVNQLIEAFLVAGALSWWMRRASLDQMEDPESFLHAVMDYPGKDVAQESCRQETRALVRSQIRSLPDRHRQAMWMRHVEDLSYVEIGCRLGLPMGTVKTHLHRGFRSLRARLSREEIEN